MKKTKVYRPRRGMRFTNGKKGVSPSAGFVGGPAITRTRPTQSKVNLALRKTDTMNPSGSVMTSVRSPEGIYTNPTTPTILTSSIYVEGAISTGRSYEKRKLNATVLGSLQSSVDKAPWPSTATMDTTMTGSFESPSWTGKNLGGNRGFVITALTSSDESISSLNYFRSGTEAIESTAVPASSSLLYSKKQSYQTVMVKKTASIFDTAVGLGSYNPRIGVPRSFYPGTGSLFSVVTGSFGVVTGSIDFPAVVRLHVPVSGKLVDIRVWVEIVHLSGQLGGIYPLGNLGVALRSPNLHWGNAHPIRNDPGMILVDRATAGNSIGRYAPDGAFTNFETSGFHRDTFLLWEGAGLIGNNEMRGPLGGFDDGVRTARYPTWQKDRSMRTIFSDSAQNPNPRHLYSPNGLAQNIAGSPSNTAYGNNVPWTSDTTVFPATESYQAAGSPPPGWLNGPGKTADTNEWPTTGSNLGTNVIRGVYPLLDPIYVRKSIGNESSLYATGVTDEAFASVELVESFRGFRPGLRGSEISGTWEVVLVQNTVAGTSPEAFFRQARLEITYTNGTDPAPVRAVSSVSPRRSGETVIYKISGSDQDTLVGAYYDWFVSNVCTDVKSQTEIGRTFGLRMNSGSVSQTNGFALLYRLTGALADISGTTPGWLTNNFMGMPSIPNSSASLILQTPTPVSGTKPDKYIFPQKVLDGARRLENVSADFNPHQTLVQLAATFVSSSAT